ncbi:MAG: CorA family divalent cation transporter [Candidatus Aenigmatarchaeota archaeon]
MIEFYIKTVKDEKLQKIYSFRDGCWINLESPENDEIEKLSKDFNLDQIWIYDSLDIDSKSRIQQDNENVLIITKIPYKDEEDEINTMPFGIIIAKNFLMTIQHQIKL